MDAYDQSTPSLHIDSTNSIYLREIAKWAKFLSILGFIMCGILAVLAFFIGTIMSSLSPVGDIGDSTAYASASIYSGRFVTILYMLIALIYIMPCLYLYRFAEKMQLALSTMDQSFLTASFSNLKSLFKFMGIMAIIMLCVYGLVILIAIFSYAVFF